MNIDEEVGTKLCLETNINQSTSHIHRSQFLLKKHTFNKKLFFSISSFLKKNKISWELLIHTAWAILLNRFSASDFITYGTGLISAKKLSKNLKINKNIDQIKSIINEKISVKSFSKKLEKQLKNINHKNNNMIQENRYLLLFRSKSRKNKKTDYHDKNLFPLILIAEKEKNPSFYILYDSKIFSSSNIDRLAVHMEILINEITNGFNKKIIKLNALTEKEENILLNKWSHPAYHFNIPNLQECVHELFSQQAKYTPHFIAVYHHDVQVTYGELNAASTYLANVLKEKGIQTGDPVGVLMERTPKLILSLLAIFKSGAIYVPINPKYPEERIEYILNDCQTDCILVDNMTFVPEKYREKAILIENISDFLNIASTTDSFPKVNPDHIAYILYTSGTTGQPKGVIIKHRSLVNLVAWYQGCFQVSSEDRASQFASQGFDTYLCEVVPFLSSGASVHIIDDHIKLTPSLLFEWLTKCKITIADFPTAFAKMIFSLPWPNNIKLRIVKIGGESINRYPTQILPFDIWNSYGPTETTIEATYIKMYVANTMSSHKHLPPPIGRPIVNSNMYIVDKYLQLVPIGVAGELLIGGIGVAVGYLNRIDLTNEKFISSPFKKGDRLYRTGDLAKWLDDGNIEFIGRVDNQVKIRGYRIELGEVEHALTQYPDVDEVAVLIKENQNNEKSIIAYIVPNLDKERYPYQERCLISVDDKYIEAITEDISKEGAAIYGMTEDIGVGKQVKISFKLPGSNEEKSFFGRIIWQNDARCGLFFEASYEEKNFIAKSIEYYLSNHNVMELLLNISSKRNLRKALQNKLPDYMIPNKFFTLLKFPLTFSGKIDKKSLPSSSDFHELGRNIHIPPDSPIEKKLTTIWRHLLHKEDISMSDNFFDIGGDSILAAELTVMLFKEFNISIPVRVLFDLPFIPILAQYIQTNGKEYTNQSVVQNEIFNDTKLEESLQPTKKLSHSIYEPQHILLTGAGGFLGIYLLQKLLKATKAKIYCLIRKGNFETPAKKFMEVINYFQLANEISLTNRRIVIIASDISKEQFGLPREQYHYLLDKIDLIYHCGAQVNIMSSYDKLRGSNVQGTLEIIKFATSYIDKPIHYISTLSSASKKNKEGIFIEEFPDNHYDNLFGGYAISKWVSEKLLAAINVRGLPVTIYRLGYISGQSDTGISNLNDALLMLIKGCIQLGFAPRMHEKITILPVDFVSQAIISISLKNPDASTVYHIDHPTGILWVELISWLNEYGYQIKLISLKEWKDKLVNIEKNNTLFPFLPYYLAMDENIRSPDVSIEKASVVLQDCSLLYPDINNHLLGIYFDYLCKANFLPLPEEQFKFDRLPIK